MAKFIYVDWLVDFLLSRSFGFEWDDGNKTKSLDKHEVETIEAEEAFSGQVVFPLGKQLNPETGGEERFGILGESRKGKKLYISFTIRETNVRVISARPMSKKEREIYEDFCKKP